MYTDSVLIPKACFIFRQGITPWKGIGKFEIHNNYDGNHLDLHLLLPFFFLVFLFSFYSLQTIKIFRRSKSNIHIGCEKLRTPHKDNAHSVTE